MKHHQSFPAMLSLIGALALIGPALATNAPAAAPPATAATRSVAASTTQATQPAAVTVVKRGSLPMRFDANGYFEPVDPFEARLRFKQYAGELTILNIVPTGAEVKKGDVLLEIDPAAMKRMVAAAEQDAAVARAALVKFQVDLKIAESADAMTLRQWETASRNAEENVTWWEQTQGPRALELAEQNTRQMKWMMEDATEELEQLRKLYKSESLTTATADIVQRRALHSQELARSRLAYQEKEEQHYKAQAHPNSHQQAIDAAVQAKNQLESFIAAQANAKVTREAGLFAARATAEAADRKLAELKADLEKLTITAPFDGVVWYGQFSMGNWANADPRALRPGEKIPAQQVVLSLVAPGKTRLVLDLFERAYYTVTPGTKVIAAPVAFPQIACEGSCDPRPRTGIPTQAGVVYPLPVKMDRDVDRRIVPGMKAMARVEVPPAQNLLLLPVSAVANGRTVWVRGKNGVESQRAVIIGRSDGKLVEIVSGVREAEEVLTQAKP